MWARGPLVADPGQVVEELLRLTPGSVLIIDEIHALPTAAAEALYEALEDRRLTVPVRTAGAGSAIRTLTFDLPPFTLVAATNQPERLPRALESRFAIRERLESYAEGELAEIALRTAAREGRRFTDEAGRRVIARASRGTPREAVLLTKRLIAASDAVLWRRLDKGIAEIMFELLEIDPRGLDAADRKIIETLKAAKRPLGLATLAAKTGIGAATILERHEPFLLRLGLIDVTPLGRVAC